MRQVDLIIHPIRFRILQTLVGQHLTTQQIADQLSDIPKSSLYRHLKLLLEGEVVDLAETRLVNGIQEKVYQLKQRPYVGPEEMATLSTAEHMQYFTVYAATLLQGFSSYLAQADDPPNMVADHVGYTEVTLNMNDAEFDQFQTQLNELLLPFIKNEPDNGRRRHKIALVTHPL